MDCILAVLSSTLLFLAAFTLIVDSLSFIQLKDYIVIPQYRIDSIYENEGVKGLLSAYFDDVWFIPSCEDGILTLPEQRYVIDILHRCGYCVDIDCESGCIYIVSSPDIGWLLQEKSL